MNLFYDRARAFIGTIAGSAAMGISAKASKQPADSGRGAGFLLVFFPEEQTAPSEKLLPCSPSASSPSASSTSSPSPSSSAAKRPLRRSSSDRLISKARSTISICALLVFVTLLVFTLSNFDAAANSTPLAVPRRLLSQAAGGSEGGAARPAAAFRLSNLWPPSGFSRRRRAAPAKHQFALQGMGTLYRRGTRAMSDLVVAHVSETATDDELRLFLRAMHRSGLTARADLALILCSKSPSFESVIREENESFSRLLHYYGRLKSNGTASKKPPAPLLGFEVSHFIRSTKTKEEVPEPLWGKKRQSNFSEHIEVNLTRFTYGSIVGFEAAELDSEDSLAGFLDHAVPLSLRRWACYQMLLGRVRRNFKHVMLVDVRSPIVLRDPLGRVRGRSAETVHLLGKHDGVVGGGSGSGRQGRKGTADRTQQGHGTVNAGLVMGGGRGVRRLAAAMLTEIVRVAMQHKKRGSVTEQAVLSQLAGNEHLLRNVELIRAAEGPNPDFAVIQQRGNSPGGVIMKQICSQEADSRVYKDCIV
ncbi:hypothetical protein SAY87_009156 [Trapa incisa]|uniref:DUF7780 domain-containing protein n=1 Tax=Trapa incisa TaxID=236973 RepID=A0AAN7JZ52_9MYRT|nr:hypothetical protein SAY87_009156 [Trapa incisa]